MKRMGRLGGIFAIAGMAAFALLIVPALAAPAQASAAPMGTSTSQSWAYGAQKWFNASGTTPNATYSVHAFFGWEVIITATNTSATTESWEVARTMAGSVYADYCQPNCTTPTLHANLSLTGWEKDAGFANLTIAANVYENGTAVAAIGLVNASFQTAANLTEKLSYTVSSHLLTGTASAALYVGGNAHGMVAFSPALGLVPLNVSTGATWNSSSSFSASGAWAVSYLATKTGFTGGTVTNKASASASINASGTVALYGHDYGTVKLNNGQTVPEIAIAITGPFDDVDGVILIPHDFDLFSGATHAWDAHGFGAEAVATSDLDVRTDGHHLRLVAAATAYGSTSAALPGGPMSGTTPAATSPQVVQAQPQSVAQAQQNAACLTGACLGAASGGLHGFGGFLVAAIVATLVVGLIAGGAVAYRRYRRGGGAMAVPAPTTTNAIQPPAGALAEPATAEGPKVA